MHVKVESCHSADHPGWLRLRQALWPQDEREHLAEMAALVAAPERVVFFRRKLA